MRSISRQDLADFEASLQTVSIPTTSRDQVYLWRLGLHFPVDIYTTAPSPALTDSKSGRLLVYKSGWTLLVSDSSASSVVTPGESHKVGWHWVIAFRLYL